MKVVAPIKTALLVSDPTLPNVCMFLSYEHFMDVPEFSWWEIFSFAGVPPPKGVKAPGAK